LLGIPLISRYSTYWTEYSRLSSQSHGQSDSKQLLVLSHWLDFKHSCNNRHFLHRYNLRKVPTIHNKAEGHNIQLSSRRKNHPVRDLFMIISKFGVELLPLPSKTNNNRLQFCLSDTTYSSRNVSVPPIDAPGKVNMLSITLIY